MTYSSHRSVNEMKNIKKAIEEYKTGKGTQKTCASNNGISLTIFRYYWNSTPNKDIIISDEQLAKKGIERRTKEIILEGGNTQTEDIFVKIPQKAKSEKIHIQKTDNKKIKVDMDNDSVQNNTNVKINPTNVKRNSGRGKIIKINPMDYALKE